MVISRTPLASLGVALEIVLLLLAIIETNLWTAMRGRDYASQSFARTDRAAAEAARIFMTSAKKNGYRPKYAARANEMCATSTIQEIPLAKRRSSPASAAAVKRTNVRDPCSA